jgi:hypothetical protein
MFCYWLYCYCPVNHFIVYSNYHVLKIQVLFLHDHSSHQWRQRCRLQSIVLFLPAIHRKCHIHIDLNGRVGKESEFLRHDNLNRQLNDNIANFIEYVPDDIFCDRLTEDLKHPNIFGNRILWYCEIILQIYAHLPLNHF